MTNEVGAAGADAAPAVPRSAALAEPSWTGRDAAWLALVCLHSGVFLRSQYLAFTGGTDPALPRRFVRRGGGRGTVERVGDAGVPDRRIAALPRARRGGRVVYQFDL